jgi:hypothetical protein
MDADEELARALQAEEQAAAAAEAAPSQQQELLAVLQGNQRKVLSVEQPGVQARALALMPLQQWRQEAAQQEALNRQLEPGAATTAEADLVVQAMLKCARRWLPRVH